MTIPGFTDLHPTIRRLLFARALRSISQGALVVDLRSTCTLWAGAASMLTGRLTEGIGKEHILKYEDKLKGGKYLLIAHGSAEEVTRAHNILQSTGAAEVTHHVEVGA